MGNPIGGGAPAYNPLSSSAAAGNPNLLDNWYLANPINQRGETTYKGAHYGIDRWKGHTSTSTQTVGDHGVYLTGYIKQYISCAYADLAGKSCALSILTDNNDLHTVSGVIPADKASASGVLFSTAWTDSNDNNRILQLRCDPDEVDDHLDVRFISINTETKIVAIKLELGSAQTLAHLEGDTWMLNDPPPNYALELAKCQRYQIVLKNLPNGTTNYARYGIGIAGTATQAIIFCALPIQLAKTPSVNYTGDLCLFNGTGTPINVTSISFDRISTNGIAIKANVANGLTEKSPYLLIAGSVGSAQVIIDANL